MTRIAHFMAFINVPLSHFSFAFRGVGLPSTERGCTPERCEDFVSSEDFMF